MPVRILMAEELVLERGENGRGDDHHGNGRGRRLGQPAQRSVDHSTERAST